ncbi:MAG: hypothetical protein ACTHMC_11485 [Pseudobacter sp.]|uniref:hypothetical protein n=1 Tax=Pseudobacter sp. TaxID=2045420 RepID=UPI003F811047
MNKRPYTKFFIQEHLQEPYQNGGIGYTDAERILEGEHYQPLFLPCHFSFSLLSKIRRLFYILRIFILLPSDSIVVFLLPQYATMNRWLVSLLGWRRSIKRVALLGDINGIKHNDPALLQKELNAYRQYDYLIVHNQWMKDWVLQQIPEASCVVINFFDFLAEPNDQPGIQGHTVAYAGNLQEGLFLNRLGDLQLVNPSILFRVYGQPYTDQMAAQPNLEYMGTSEPYALPKKLKASYGLVWYGDSLDEVSGNIGPYLSIISPHKASLYLLCGIPLIVPEHTALAGLVQQYKLGIAISNLHSIQSAIDSITSQEYASICNNVRTIATSVSTGQGFRLALHKIENHYSACAQ